MARALIGVRNIVLFSAVLVMGTALIKSRQAFPPVAGVGEKWKYFERHGAEYNALFLGSSRLYQHVDPRLFDAVVKRDSGQQVRSFNFGYLALWPPESFWLTRKVLQQRSENLRWMFVDVMNIRPNADPAIMGDRVGYWHDAQHTRMALQSVADTGWRWRRKRAACSEHLGYFMKEATNQGRGAEWIEERFGVARKKKPKPPEWSDTEGFLPERRASTVTEQQWKEYEEAVSQMKLQFTRRPATGGLRRAVQELSADAAGHGVELIFLVTPSIDPHERFGGLGEVARVWYFDDPREYPELYDRAVHYDYTHLNEQGARLFTTLVANRFVSHLNGRN